VATNAGQVEGRLLRIAKEQFAKDMERHGISKEIKGIETTSPSRQEGDQ
jgi:hypothetical protein